MERGLSSTMEIQTMIILNIQDKKIISLKHKYDEKIKNDRLIGIDDEFFFL